MPLEWYSQAAYRCRLEWGRRGARDAAARGDALVVVDTITFSTTVAAAIHHGAVILPCAWEDDPEAYARRIGAEAAVRREELAVRGRFTLTPHTFYEIEPGTRVVLASPNGATCSHYGRDVRHLFVGALVNARAVAEAVQKVANETNSNVTVLACGERWESPTEEGELRFAIEDYLGAGAIVSYLNFEKSPEALAAEAAFAGVRERIAPVLWESGSGIEMRERGYGHEVELAAQLNIFTCAPYLRDGRLEAISR